MGRPLNIFATTCLALLVFAGGGFLMFTVSASFIWLFTFDVPVSKAAGAAAGLLFGGLVAAPLVLRLLRLLRTRSE